MVETKVKMGEEGEEEGAGREGQATREVREVDDVLAVLRVRRNIVCRHEAHPDLDDGRQQAGTLILLDLLLRDGGATPSAPALGHLFVDGVWRRRNGRKRRRRGS